MKQQKAGIATTIFVGVGFDSDNAPIVEEERADIRHKILLRTVREFSGVTIIDADGAWMNDAGRVVEEKTLQVIVYSYRPGGAHRVRLDRLLRFILHVSRQTSILVDDRASPEAYLVFADAFGAAGVEHA